MHACVHMYNAVPVGIIVCNTFRDLEDLFQDYERSVNEVAKKKNEHGKLVVLHDKLVSEIQYKVR